MCGLPLFTAMERYIPELQQVGEHGRPLVVDGEAVPGRRSLRPPGDQGPASAGGEVPQPPRTPLYLLLRRRPPG